MHETKEVTLLKNMKEKAFEKKKYFKPTLKKRMVSSIEWY